jgi:hypothetical protein
MHSMKLQITQRLDLFRFFYHDWIDMELTQVIFTRAHSSIQPKLIGKASVSRALENIFLKIQKIRYKYLLAYQNS